MILDKPKLDIIEEVEGAVIQHGPLSDRIYLMKLADADCDSLIPALLELAEEEDYSKIFTKVPMTEAEPFILHGFDAEATIPKMYNGKEDALMFGYYLEERRKVEKDSDKLDEIVDLSLTKSGKGVGPDLGADYNLRKCTQDDVEQMAEIYGDVFDTYPFPIDEPEYLLETMQSHVAYFAIEVKGEIVALASAEMDRASASAEMTDFATRTDRRGKGFAVHLLAKMEEFTRAMGIKTVFTIARAVSPGMNITFAKLGYRYGGRLINNTNISGSIESMNVWHKSL
jgi:beta-lysine N6-acetyltransferase